MLHILRQIAKTGIKTDATPSADLDRIVVSRLNEQILKTLGRALTIRQVDAGSCNGCELEIHALGNPYYNIEGLGVRFVASPRHADMLLVTGPVSKHMAIALKRTYDATPDPKLVVAVGDSGCTGGIFGESYASLGGVASVIPVDVAIPGCPPSPAALLQGILAAVAAVAPRIEPSLTPGFELPDTSVDGSTGRPELPATPVDASRGQAELPPTPVDPASRPPLESRR